MVGCEKCERGEMMQREERVEDGNRNKAWMSEWMMKATMEWVWYGSKWMSEYRCERLLAGHGQVWIRWKGRKVCGCGGWVDGWVWGGGKARAWGGAKWDVCCYSYCVPVRSDLFQEVYRDASPPQTDPSFDHSLLLSITGVRVTGFSFLFFFPFLLTLSREKISLLISRRYYIWSSYFIRTRVGYAGGGNRFNSWYD